MVFENVAVAKVDLSQFVVDDVTLPAEGKDVKPSNKDDGQEKPRTRRTKAQAVAASKEEAKRTLFVANLPLACALSDSTERQLLKWIRQHIVADDSSSEKTSDDNRGEGKDGAVESVRFRQPIVHDKNGKLVEHADLKLLRQSRKLRKSTLEHDKRASVSAYIVLRREESVARALSALPREFLGRHLRIDSAVSASTPSHKRSLFLGNLPRDLQDDELWTALSSSLPASCRVQSVRILRDKGSAVGKGIAYVAFEERTAVKLALDHHFTTPLIIRGRTIRMEKCQPPK